MQRTITAFRNAQLNARRVALESAGPAPTELIAVATETAFEITLTQPARADINVVLPATIDRGKLERYIFDLHRLLGAHRSTQALAVDLFGIEYRIQVNGLIHRLRRFHGKFAHGNRGDL